MFYFKSLRTQNYKINTVGEHKIHDNSRHWHFIFTNIPVQNYRKVKTGQILHVSVTVYKIPYSIILTKNGFINFSYHLSTTLT